MSFKVVRNEAGECIAFGPNDENYEPLLPYTIEEDIPTLYAPPITIQQQLADLDSSNALTQRNLRETVMLMAEAFKTLSGGAVDLTVIPGVAKVFSVEAEAAALREQL